jgi:hypothetical protein
VSLHSAGTMERGLSLDSLAQRSLPALLQGGLRLAHMAGLTCPVGPVHSWHLVAHPFGFRTSEMPSLQ